MSGKSDKWGGARFVHITNVDKAKAITAAFRFNDEKAVLEYEFARCSSNDVFSKEIGRKVSHGRLGAHPKTIPYTELPEDKNYQGLLQGVVSRVVAQKGLQRRNVAA